MLPLFYMQRKSFMLSILLIAGSCNAQEQLYYQIRADVYSEPLSIKSSISRNHGFSAKLDGELYGDPEESVGLRGKNCQYSIL